MGIMIEDGVLMYHGLETGTKVVGAKQTGKAIAAGNVECVFIAENADPAITDQFAAVCADKNIRVEFFPDMHTLGAACGIKVGAAVAALLKDSSGL